MNVFIQGIRRSATTFLFDVLCADGRFDAYYEPLAAARRPAVGGGSQVRAEDFFEKIRRVRKEYAEAVGLDDPRVLNWGAPRNAELETGQEWDPWVEGYLQFLLDRSDHTLLKFVRAYDKVERLQELDPGACLFHIVRDPRAVATSFLFGKGQVHRALFARPDTFFGYRGDPGRDGAEGPRNLQALQVADWLSEQGQLDVDPDGPVYERLLALWGYHFRQTHRDGRACFGERYRLVRYEDLLQRPEDTLAQLYAALGESCRPSALQWLQTHAAERPQVFAESDSRWAKSLERLGLGPSLAEAGYEPVSPQPVILTS